VVVLTTRLVGGRFGMSLAREVVKSFVVSVVLEDGITDFQKELLHKVKWNRLKNTGRVVCHQEITIWFARGTKVK